MKTRRNVIVYIGISADGYIARPDGDVSRLDRPQPKGQYGMCDFMQSVDTILGVERPTPRTLLVVESSTTLHHSGERRSIAGA